MTASDAVAALELELRAARRTIDVLCDTVEERTAANGDLRLTIEMSRLEQIVQRRTEELQCAMFELHAAQDRLVDAQKHQAIGLLAAGIAHEINTPMQYIGDNARFLEKAFAELLDAIPAGAGAEDPRLARRLATLRQRIPRALTSTCEGVDAVNKIVRAMKEFSHPGSSEKTPFDLNQTIRSTVAVSRNEWKYVASLTMSLGDDLPLAFGLQHELGQVLLNIIINAAHAVADVHVGASAVTGQIHITTAVDPNGIRLRIRDNGTGIPVANRQRIFEPFFTTKPVGKGTGQGLAIARAIVVDQHGGTIAVTSDDDPVSPDRGTTFDLVLPVAPPGTPGRRRTGVIGVVV